MPNDLDGLTERLAARERIVVDPLTGGAKGSKLARYDLIPPAALFQLAEHYGIGEAKYPSEGDPPKANWTRGYRWSLSFAAMMRHAWAFWDGEDIDAETGSPHLVACAWHAFALLTFMESHPELDDRP